VTTLSSALPAISTVFAFTVRDLPTVNALLNAVATVLLLLGFYLIKSGREQAHKRTMLSVFVVSILFLACYLTYHAQAMHVPFTGPDAARYVYYAILLPHVVLAATVPVLALMTIYFGMTDQRARHRRIARWTFPIWLFVSVTGVIVYLMLYQLYPGPTVEL
jgi:putative membrane protein